MTTNKDRERIIRLVEENLRLLSELRATYSPGLVDVVADTDVVTSPSVVDALCRPTMETLVQEHLRVVILNTRNRVLDVVTIYQGQVASAQVARMAEVFREAVIRNAPAIIMVHNHPSGDPTPSPDDIALTKTAHEAGELLGIEVLDHVIIGSGGRYISLNERGLMRGRTA